MDFGLFTMFSVREGGTQFQTFQEWFDLVQVAEAMGLDTMTSTWSPSLISALIHPSALP